MSSLSPSFMPSQMDEASSSGSVRDPNSPKKLVSSRVLEFMNTLKVEDFPQLGVRADGPGYTVGLPQDNESVATVRPSTNQPHEPHFFFFYRDVITLIGVRFPFTDFQIDLLNHLQLAPSQLHPNGWAFAVAFESLCKNLNVRCTVPVFMTFYAPLETSTFKSGKNFWFGWTTFRGRGDHKLFKVFIDSWKNFKSAFVKIKAIPFECPWFLTKSDSGSLEGRFPLYWTNVHHKLKSGAYTPNPASLNTEEEEAVERLITHSSSLSSLMDPRDYMSISSLKRRAGKGMRSLVYLYCMHVRNLYLLIAQLTFSLHIGQKMVRPPHLGLLKEIRLRADPAGSGVPPLLMNQRWATSHLCQEQ